MILGQVAPGAASDTDLYTVPEKKLATVRVLVAERAGASALYRIAVRPLGASIVTKHYITFDRVLGANLDAHSVPFEIGATDVITVRSSTTGLSFTATGVEEPEVE